MTAKGTTNSDCPICQECIASSPWGVSTTCGHPYHEDCWNEYVAAESAKQDGLDDVPVPCPICKCLTKDLIHVYIDLGEGDCKTGVTLPVEKDDGYDDYRGRNSIKEKYDKLNSTCRSLRSANRNLAVENKELKSSESRLQAENAELKLVLEDITYGTEQHEHNYDKLQKKHDKLQLKFDEMKREFIEYKSIVQIHECKDLEAKERRRRRGSRGGAQDQNNLELLHVNAFLKNLAINDC